MSKKFIYVKLTKEWGGFQIGDVIRFGYSKGIGRIDNNEGVEVPKQRAVNDPPEEVRVPVKEPPKVETATAPPAAENAMASPVLTEKPKPEEMIKVSKKGKTKSKE